MRATGWIALLVACLLPISASAQNEPAERSGVAPLPDSLRLYGVTLPTNPQLPDFGGPDDALRLTLDEAIAVALAQNPDAAVSQLEAQRAARDVTLGNAGYLPTVDVNAGVSGFRGGGLFGGDQQGGGAQGGGGGGNVRTSTIADASIVLGYTIYDGGLRSATYRRLQADARRLQLLAEADAEALVLEVATAYLDVARQVALADAFAEALAVSRTRLSITQSEVRIGTAAEIDAALALADYNADRSNLLQQQVRAAGARATLGGLMALSNPTGVAPSDTLALGPPPNLEALTSQATDQSRRIRALEEGEAVAAQQVDQVRSEYLPTIRGTVSGGVTSFDQGFAPPAFDPTVGPDVRYGLTASLPLFDGGERSRRVANARVALRQAELTTSGERLSTQARAARLSATASGFRALSDLEALNESIARENVRVALAQLRLGFITPVDLRQIQLTLVDVRTRRVETVYQALIAEAELRLLAGELLPAELER